MFLDIVSIVRTNVENSIARLGLSGIKIHNLVSIYVMILNENS